MKLFTKLLPATFLLLSLALLVPTEYIHADDGLSELDFDPETKVLISEIQVRTEDDPYNEFVELYNLSEETIDISGWKLEYMTASGDSWSSKIRSEQTSEPVLTIEPESYYIFGTENFIGANPELEVERTLSSGAAESGGHIRLIRPDSDNPNSRLIVDLVGWGSAENSLGEPAPIPERSGSIYRCFDNDELINTDNNAEDFRFSDEPKPSEAYECPEDTDENDQNQDNENEDEESSSEDSNEICENLIISELMPAEDQGYIELYNTGSSGTDLQGCGLEFIIDSENDSFTETIWIEDSIEVDADEYAIIYLEALGVTLIEEAEIIIYLLSKQDDQEKELDEISLVNENRRNQSWAWFDEGWEWTYEPTPREPNAKQPYDSVCEGIIISELLPNPEGPRSQRPREEHAFIELHNPTPETVNLIGCGLQTLSVNSQNYSNVYWFDENLILEPDTYLAVYERDSGIALPVGVAGQAFLLSANEDEIDAIGYEPEIPEGASWSLLENDWQWSYAKTPDEANQAMALKPCPEDNQERNPDTGRCRSVGSDEPEYEPCGPGRERNPETNRCRQIGANEPDYVPCDPDEERNPETNRCRQIGVGEPDYVPCDPGEERNPETNRCRSVTTASSSLKPCGPNQERNPETNRCRTVAAPNEGTIAGVQDIETVRQNPIGWWLAGIALLFAAAYGIWEWRYDLANLLYRWRNSNGVD